MVSQGQGDKGDQNKKIIMGKVEDATSKSDIKSDDYIVTESISSEDELYQAN